MNKNDMLLGELREFKRATIEEISGLKNSIDNLRVDLKGDIEPLKTFRWKITGIAGFCAFLGGAIIDYIRH